MLIAALYFMAFLSLTLVYRAFLQFLYRSELTIHSRVENFLGTERQAPKPVEMKNRGQFFAEEKISTLAEKMKVFLSKKLSAEAKSDLEKKLLDAGVVKWTAVDFRLLQLLAGLLLFFLGFLLFGRTTGKTMSLFLLSSALGGLGFYYPIFYLGARKTQRLAKIQKSLADFFDMVNLSVEAGMGLDAAIMRVCKNKEGPLSEEFLRAIEEMRLGKSRRDAFINLRARVSLDAFQSIMTSLIQADQLGIGMSKVLRALTDRIREHQRQLAREKAMKAPIKMLFPMVLFIFPAIFIILLGPLIIYLLQNGLGG
ncbi:type II secretion system F family protein [Neobacillus notoginsengisoli]|uniref:Type II secretion system F family protein n=1 Tax=Neobacillus notoginsengisoli TaxID=1578198 RepID=A0A417YYC9_9BACI|nr:type II secretion system F family protein [Neobacillus notoginsengisoli]RHW42540.1 type II secretion system F family protein [Neobacillus notoginsengisoli]